MKFKKKILIIIFGLVFMGRVDFSLFSMIDSEQNKNLYEAIIYGMSVSEFEQLLEQETIDINFQTKSVYRFEESEIGGEITIPTGFTFLHTAIKFKKWDIAEFLVANGANVFLVSTGIQVTPFHYLVLSRRADEVEDEEILKLAVMIFEKCSSIINVCSKHGNAPLHYAAREGFIDMVEYLIVKDAVVNSESGQFIINCSNLDGQTPLDLVLEFVEDIQRKDQIVKILRDHGGMTNEEILYSMDEEGDTDDIVELVSSSDTEKDKVGEFDIRIQSQWRWGRCTIL